jgi:hypothetical protein
MVKDVFCGKNSATTALVNCHFEDYLAQVFENYLARRAAMPISPQRRTLGDPAVRRTVRVDRR